MPLFGCDIADTAQTLNNQSINQIYQSIKTLFYEIQYKKFKNYEGKEIER